MKKFLINLIDLISKKYPMTKFLIGTLGNWDLIRLIRN